MRNDLVDTLDDGGADHRELCSERRGGPGGAAQLQPRHRDPAGAAAAQLRRGPGRAQDITRMYVF